MFISVGMKGPLEQQKSCRKSALDALSYPKPASNFSATNVVASLKTGDIPGLVLFLVSLLCLRAESMKLRVCYYFRSSLTHL